MVSGMVTMDVAGFEAELKADRDFTMREWRRYYTKVARETATRIIKRTPVDTGETKGLYKISFGAPQDSYATDRTPVLTAIQTISSYLRTTQAPFASMYMTNTSDAWEVLEYGLFQPPDPGPSKDRRRGRKGKILVSGGFSTQAPRGMAAITLTEIEREFP